MKDLTKGNVVSQLILFSIPMILSDLIQGIQSIIDVFWLGRLTDYVGVSAVSITMPIIFILMSILIGVGASSAILIGQAFGAKDYKILGKVLKNSFTITLVLSSILGLIGFILSVPVLKLIGSPQNIFDLSLIYLQVLAITLPFASIYNWFIGVIRGLGNSRIVLVFSIIFIVLKLIITPILISGFWIIPPLGVLGAALSGAIVEFLLLIIAYVYLTSKYEIIRNNIGFEFDRGIISKFIFIGLPISIQMLIISFSVAILMGFVSKFGDKAIATFGIGNRIDQFAFLPAMSMGMAIMTFVSQNLGANREDRVAEALKWGMIISISISLVVAVIVNLFSTGIFRFFVSDNEVIMMGKSYLFIMSFSYVLMGIVFALQGVIRGAGDTLTVLIIKALSMILIRVPIAYLLAFVIFKSSDGIWASFLAVMLFESIVSYFYYKSGKWKEKVVFKREPKKVIPEFEVLPNEQK
jgi:putative MATE family efflux protein